MFQGWARLDGASAPAGACRHHGKALRKLLAGSLRPLEIASKQSSSQNMPVKKAEADKITNQQRQQRIGDSSLNDLADSSTQ